MSAASWRVWFRGKPTCPCVAEWFPVYEQMLKHRGIRSGFYDGRTLAIMQLTGTASASAGTHSQGGAMDTAMLDPAGIRVAREMGASASWRRLWHNNLHSHLVLEGCPHNGPARYQIRAVKLGRDGTGLMGLGGKDTEWRPKKWRTWEEGLFWAAIELGTSGAGREWDEMASREEVRAEVVAGVKQALVEIEARRTSADRNAGNAFWKLIRDALKGGLVEIARRATPLDRQASDAIRDENAAGVIRERQQRTS